MLHAQSMVAIFQGQPLIRDRRETFIRDSHEFLKSNKLYADRSNGDTLMIQGIKGTPVNMYSQQKLITN
jgi:hypothetical protein